MNFIQEIVFENIVWWMAAILSRPQRVKNMSEDNRDTQQY